VSKGWNRPEIWFALIVIPASLLVSGIAGLHLFMTRTATPLHPEPQRVPSVAGANPSRQWAGAVERGRQVVRVGLSEQNLPGLSVAVGAGGEIVWAEGFGWADLESKVPVAPNLRFRIGTASTVLTSAAVGLLLEDGRLTLDDQIQAYVPEFPKKEWPVTLRQLMGHVAGVANDGGDEGPLFAHRCDGPVDALQFLSGYERELLFEPGTRFRYSSYGWIVVSAAIETAAKQPFLAFMRKQIFEPLKMTDTIADSATDPIPAQVTSYFPRYAAEPRYGLHLTRTIDLSCYAGSSVFLSTPSDLVRFGLAINGGKLLQSATVELLQTSQRLASGEETGYGLGWDLETVAQDGQETQVVGHDGTVLGGTVASLMVVRDEGIVVAVISNISYADTPSLALRIAQAFATQAGSPESGAPAMQD
jgi:CubicO group peptidase (beta-lactamase class C family)